MYVTSNAEHYDLPCFFWAMYLMFKQIDSLQPKLYVGFLCSGNGEFWTSFCRHWSNTWMVDGDHKMDAPFMDKYSGSLWKRGDVPRLKNWWWTDGFGIAAIIRQPPSFFQISLKCQLAWLPYIIPCYIPLLLIGNGKSHSIIPLIHQIHYIQPMIGVISHYIPMIIQILSPYYQWLVTNVISHYIPIHW